MNTKILKTLILAAGLTGFTLRAAFSVIGYDGRSLPIRGHWATVALLCLSVAVLVCLLLLCWRISGGDDSADTRPASPLAALGCFAAAIGIAVTGIRELREGLLPAQNFLWILGFASAAAFVFIGVCRLRGSKPYFLFHSVICIFFALRTLMQYRAYSYDPALTEYVFCLLAYVALLLNVYHHAAFDAGLGSHRFLWITGLAGVYFSITALINCPDATLLGPCAIWALTNLSVRRRDLPQPEEEGESL